MPLAEAVEAITARRSIKVDAINPVNFIVCFYLLCFDEVLLLVVLVVLLLMCVCSLVFYLCLCRVLVDEVLMILTLM